MKRIIKKLPKKGIVITLLLAIVLKYSLPLAKVFADDEYVLKFKIGNNNQTEHTMLIDNEILTIDGQYVTLENGSNEPIGTVACNNDNTECTITVTNGQAGRLNYNSGKKFTLYVQGNSLNFEYEFSKNEDIAIQDYVEPTPPQNPNNPQEPNNNQQEDERFDGRAVVLWSCDSGVCYHEFSVVDPENCNPEEENSPACAKEIEDFDDGNSTFFKASDIKADNKPSRTFDTSAEYRGWYIKDTFDAWVEDYELATGHDINWATLDPEIILGEPNQNVGQFESGAIANGCVKPDEDSGWREEDVFKECVNHYAATQGHIWTRKLQPVGEPNDNNAYVSYGDRNFKVVIYNDNFKGITIGDLEDLNYYPTHWVDPFLRTDQYDVSGTTKNKPTLLDSILLDNIVTIKTLPYNNYQIESIEPLDVPENAVSVNKEGNKFKLTFSSNFYDHVVFKITDSENEISYIKVKRYTIDATISFIDNHPAIAADFYFDRDKHYNQFDITAKIVYKDGSTKTVNLVPCKGVDNGLGDFDDVFEVDQENPQHGPKGKGLMKAFFIFNLEDGEDRTIDKIYMNAEYKGSDAENYAGAYAGSGEGTLANIYREEVE